MSEERKVRFRLVGAKSDDGPMFFKMESPNDHAALVELDGLLPPTALHTSTSYENRPL